jgi:predicted nucleotide-binding protein (sugar kinase/HSP70/actin superfamily)
MFLQSFGCHCDDMLIMYTNDMQEEDPWLPVCTVMEVARRPPSGEVKRRVSLLRNHLQEYWGTRGVSDYLQGKLGMSFSSV